MVQELRSTGGGTKALLILQGRSSQLSAPGSGLTRSSSVPWAHSYSFSWSLLTFIVCARAYESVCLLLYPRLDQICSHLAAAPRVLGLQACTITPVDHINPGFLGVTGSKLYLLPWGAHGPRENSSR